MPFMHDRLTLRPAAAGAHGERDAAVTEPHGGLRLFLPDGEQIAPSPEVMALALDELAGCLPRLPTQLRLLITDPTELGHRIGAGHLRARPLRGDKRDAAARRMHRQVDMLDVLARHGDGDLAELDRLAPSVSRLVLDEFEERQRGLAVAVEQREERIQDLRLARLVALPARGRPLAHHAVDLEAPT